MKILYLILFVYIGAFGIVNAWGSQKVKLTDVKTLTLHHGAMTTGRRSRPVPQLQCVGGTAGCSSFTPKVVQCYNRGSDGYDVQWECKTDMDNAYRFGAVDVACEGYDYADDPYILKGSCGLEYNLDLTEEGKQKKGNHYSYFTTGNAQKSNESGFGDLVLVVIVVLLIIAVAMTCTRGETRDPTSTGFREPSPGFGTGFSGAQPPPPPGFRTNVGTGYDGGCSGSTMGDDASRTYNTAGSGRPGFWTGAMTGGVLGYLFGNSNRNTGYYSQQRPFTQSDTWGSQSRGGATFGTTRRDDDGGSSSSSGTRTASGFGGTKRR